MEAYSTQNKKNFFTAIEGINIIPPRDKIGELLRKKPIREGEWAYLDVEVWRMDDARLKGFTKGFEKYVNHQHGRVTDQMITRNFCLLRIQSNKTLLNDVLGLPEISRVDRPPEVEIDEAMQVGLEEFEPIKSPSKESHGILVVDSGLRHHPLLENAIGDEIYLPLPNGKITSEYDDVGHGTEVAGVALYGDVEQCILNRNFFAEAWIYSAKVLYKGNGGIAYGDPEKLLHHQLRDAIETILKKHKKCKVINISFANIEDRMFEGQSQFNLAALLDELCEQFQIIIVVSVGNYEKGNSEDYPNYLLDSSDKVKIADPSCSALAFSVGSIYKRKVGTSGDYVDMPSPFTRTGPGYRGMIKPEFVEYGGGPQGGIVTINPDWIKEGNLFRIKPGTSLSAPRVANHAVKIFNRYPSFSANLIQALLLSSASIPMEKPGDLATMTVRDNEETQMKIYSIYGYGKPNLESALYSNNNRVLLVKDDVVKVNHIRLYTLHLPDNFVNEMGNRAISINLAFNPPVNKNRSSYLGVVFELHLFKNISAEQVKQAYGDLPITESPSDSDSEELVPQKIKKYEIKLRPGPNIRKRGVHQKGTVTYSKKPMIDASNPLILAVVCRDRGWIERDYEQGYGIVVSVEHSKEVDLYTQMRQRNVQRARIR